MDLESPKPIEEWTDDELLAQHRFIKAELTEESSFKKSGDNRPLDVIEEEIRRRGLRVPDDASSRYTRTGKARAGPTPLVTAFLQAKRIRASRDV